MSDEDERLENLDEQPWVGIKTQSGNSIIVKYIFSHKSYELLLSDGISCYYERMEAEELSERNKETNPSLELTQGKLLHLIKSAFTGERNVKMIVKKESDKIQCSFTYSISGTLFQWKIIARRQVERMKSDLLSPLFQMAEELSRRQAVLFTKLREKDKEIDDLKNQGVKCSRKHLETPIFDESLFHESMKNAKAFKDICKDDDNMGFSPHLQRFYKEIMKKKCESDDEDIPASGSGNNASNSPVKSVRESPKKTSDQMRKEANDRKKAEEYNTPVVQSKKKKKLKI
ncbi:DgyrCDS4345 [Dimorphilus gyrociliatus]|uniref:Non-homologous end-joining factor 1 n=1 Tax=Dimorphilus gyrociliatus TaxID=2664684 RepID=A0A7I8VLC9_9ANNE|nr:DgyrCDS4345 [Dimorphilus gyrociliatus]